MLARCRRAYHRVLMLSRSIVDLASSDEIQPNHLAEALQYRVRHDYQIQALEGNKI